MKRLLLIGASGHLGRRLVPRLPDFELAAPGHRELDLADPAGLRRFLRDRRFDTILIVGGNTEIEDCEADPAGAFAANAEGPGVIAESAPAAHLIYFSTDCVFDGRGGPHPVDAPTCPTNAYGRSKAEGERRVRRGRWTVVRTCHIYSFQPDHNNFFMFVARRVLAGEPVIGWTDQRTTPTEADDLADATCRIVREGTEGIVHLAGREPCTRYEFACEVARAFGREGAIRPGLMPDDLRPRQAGLVADLIPYREGIARQRRLWR